VDLTLSPAQEEFRDTLRAWIAEHHPGREPDGDDESFEFRRAWQRELNARGWAGLTWPAEFGGAGATQIEQAIFFEEIARARAPQMANVLGLTMGGPTVIAHGTDEQKARFLAPILSADEMWCQGFSEPESGERYLRRQVGRLASVLIERGGDGRTEGFAPFRFTPGRPDAGHIVRGVAERIEEGVLIGRAAP
jgi:alkylation response protein AidB-like acyl-CoA dehydrogenase